MLDHQGTSSCSERRRAEPLLLAAVILLLAACAPVVTDPESSPAPGKRQTVVIVHGAWGGGWDWRETADVLEAMGYDTFRPTLTGLGERNHLLSADIDLTTHVTDIVNVLVWEQLEDVILVGHSYGGMVITGVAEIVPERIARLVYFDAFVPFDGECVMSVGRSGMVGELCRLASLGRLTGMVPDGGGMKPPWITEGTPPPTDVPHPIGTFVEPISLAGEPGHGLAAKYIITRETAGGPDDFNVAADRAAALGWPVEEYIGNHVPYREDPEGIARAFVTFDPGGGD